MRYGYKDIVLPHLTIRAKHIADSKIRNHRSQSNSEDTDHRSLYVYSSVMIEPNYHSQCMSCVNEATPHAAESGELEVIRLVLHILTQIGQVSKRHESPQVQA